MAPLTGTEAAPAVGSCVDVIGGNYRGRRCLVVGESKEFWELRWEGSATFKVRKYNVRKVEGSVVEENDSEFEDCLSENNLAPEELSPKEEAVIGSHCLSILSWNTDLDAFPPRAFSKSNSASEASSPSWAGTKRPWESTSSTSPWRSRSRGLKWWSCKRCRSCRGRAGWRSCVRGSTKRSSTPALARRASSASPPSLPRLDQKATLTEMSDLSFKYPPLMALLRDDRFSFHSLQRIVLTSVHTPGSADLQRSRQRALEVNRLLSGLQQEAISRFNDNQGLLFSDKRVRKKADAAKACAVPFVLCGDFNTDFFKSECGTKPDLRNEFFQGIDFRPLPSVNRVEAHTASGSWIGGAPPGRVTSGGKRCLDFFFWNADCAKRAEFAVRPMHLSQEALKKAGHPGLSDHDAVVLEVREDPVHRLQERAALSQREG